MLEVNGRYFATRNFIALQNTVGGDVMILARSDDGSYKVMDTHPSWHRAVDFIRFADRNENEVEESPKC